MPEKIDWQICECGKRFRGYDWESCPECTEGFKRAVHENPHGNLPNSPDDKK